MYIAGAKRAVDTGDTYLAELKGLHVAASATAQKRSGERVRIARMPVSDDPPLKARVNYARWVVDCQNCGNAEFAFEDGLFLCSQCRNSNVGGQVRKVEMPAERAQIETALAKRNIVNRHWQPGEPVKQLEKENKVEALL